MTNFNPDKQKENRSYGFGYDGDDLQSDYSFGSGADSRFNEEKASDESSYNTANNNSGLTQNKPFVSSFFDEIPSSYTANQYTEQNHSTAPAYNGYGAYGQNNNTAPFSAQNASVTYETKTKKKKKYSKKSTVALMLVACLVVSCIFGFGSGYLANNVFGSSDKSSTNNTTSGGSNVIYQAPAQTSSDTQSATKVGNEMTVSEIATATMNSVVEIKTESTTEGLFMMQQTTQGAGSGVIITDTGYIITNYHVIKDSSTVSVKLHNGNSYDAKVIGYDEDLDIAMIKIKATEKLIPVVLGNSAEIKVGDLAVAVGNPLGELGGTVTDGIISALDREITVENTKMKLLQVSAAINPGNSGGGLFNSKGELIGIVNAKSTGTGVEGLGFAIPIDYVKDYFDDLIDYGYIKGRPYIGVTTAYITSLQQAYYYNLSETGMYINQVTTGSPAESGGLKSRDLVVSANGTAITNSETLSDIVSACKVGDKLSMVIKRNGQEMKLTIVVGEKKSDLKS